MGRYGLILGPIEAYTQNIAIGTIVDPIPGHRNSKKYKNILQTEHIYKILYKLPINRLSG